MKDYYNSPEELFDNGDARYTLLDGYINPMLEDESTEPAVKKELQNIKDSEKLQDEVIDLIKNYLNDSDSLNEYVIDYDADELGNMDSPWNTVIDISYTAIEEFIKDRLKESDNGNNWAKEFKDYENLW